MKTALVAKIALSIAGITTAAISLAALFPARRMSQYRIGIAVEAQHMSIIFIVRQGF